MPFGLSDKRDPKRLRSVRARYGVTRSDDEVERSPHSMRIRFRRGRRMSHNCIQITAKQFQHGRFSFL
jgi:hypothetical protein